MLMDGEKRQRERGVKLWLVGMNPRVIEMVQKSPLGRRSGMTACTSILRSPFPGTSAPWGLPA